MSRGDETRLFVLAELARRGEAHGHELRREAQIGRSELWTAVKIGSIYAVLRRLEQDGLVQPERSERVGLMPERTIYRITDEGRRELKVLRDAALAQVVVPPDPFDLAFSFTEDMDIADLTAVIETRISELTLRSESLERQRQSAADYLDARDQLLFRHLAVRIDTEIDWHREILASLTQREES